ncbi:D-alanyl-D-alanine carboxypeptidase/D-alanyl-D-alanine-endopeptidase [Nocardioides sp.]|uniref:D-alanyl-D-alanine carboxypeptidase/D-alanyl-D-alanine endopeptidase n=1 Tax=Nocardioides sp. TaxID=35761 RepID=UPI002B2799B9|nr:D-alanyl-D-alanine carboxypeptidase/D-alanyl-D-alanine-endopeptidase [Nocardioides sp.]
MPTSSRRPRAAAASSTGPSRGSVRATLALVLFLALVAGGVATWRYDLLDGRLDALIGTGPDAPATGDPAAVAPPPGLDLPPVVAPGPVADASSTGGSLDAAAVRSALAPYLRDPDLGRHVRVAVAPLGDAPVVFASGSRPAIPASTTKLVTTVAARLALGPDHVFSTSVRLGPTEGAKGTRAALTLVGGGDPFLERAPTTPDGDAWPYPARADVATLAEATAAVLGEQGVRRVRLSYDDSLFTGPAINPTWEDDYIPGVVTPTSALWVDVGRTLSRSSRVDDPSGEAAGAFAASLRGAGIKVSGSPTPGSAASRSRVVAQVDSAPLSQIVQRVVDVSDNEASEALLRHIGIAEYDDGSTDSGRRGVRALLRSAGVRLAGSTFYDGSGLSRANRAEPGVLLDVLRLAADPTRPDLRAAVEGLPVAGFTGSLRLRMDEGPPAGLGRVRAKTGTLRAVSSLAGLGTDLDGTVFAFVLMADAIALEDTLDARQALDSAAAALGACRCSG